MTHPPDNNPLLADVLAEATPPAFREALLGETLRLARRRRCCRRIQRISAVALTVLAVLAVLINLPRRHAVPPPTAVGCQIVHTQPLPAEAIVTTQPLPADRLVASVATAAIVQTTATSGRWREIDDDQLLALVAPRPAVLVRFGPHAAELILLNPEDQNLSKGVEPEGLDQQ